MDRQLKEGTIGLAFKWLADAEGHSYESHVQHKEVLSMEECFDERQAERDRLRSLPETSSEAEILRLEAAARQGETDEPRVLYCKSANVG